MDVELVKGKGLYKELTSHMGDLKKIIFNNTIAEIDVMDKLIDQLDNAEDCYKIIILRNRNRSLDLTIYYDSNYRVTWSDSYDECKIETLEEDIECDVADKYSLKEFIAQSRDKILKIAERNPVIKKGDEWYDEDFWDNV